MKNTLTSLLLFFALIGAAEAQTVISGRVKVKGDILGITGATVSVKGHNISVFTDIQGDYTISLPEGANVLVFAFNGFQTQEIEVGNRSVVDAEMVATKDTEDELLVGYNSTSKRSSTNSISSIDGSDLANQAVPTLEQANQGKAAGVLVQGGSGELGSASSILIRGGSSLTGSNQPLYVVDGIPLTSGNQSNINPDNIASIQVLKDASSTAIYGSRAANGVILITTKSGSGGKTKIGIDYQFGVGSSPKRLDLYNSEDHLAQLFESGIKASTTNPLFRGLWIRTGNDIAILNDINNSFSDQNLRTWVAEETITTNSGLRIDASNTTQLGNLVRSFVDAKSNLTFNTNWQDEVFRTSIMNKAGINISGGDNNSSYFGSVSYLNQEGILIGNDFERINFQLNLRKKVSSSSSIDLSLSGGRSINNRLSADADLGTPLRALLLPPSDEGDPNNAFNLRTFSGRNFYNPVTEVTFSDFIESSNFLIGNLGFKHQLTDKLSFKIDGGLDFSDDNLERRQGPETLDGNPTGISRLVETNTFNYLINSFLNYKTAIGSQSSLSATLGSSYQKSDASITEKSARINSLSELRSLGEEDPSLLNNPVPGSASSFLSFYTQLNYSLNNKYFFQVSARVDGSSRFSPDNRFGAFPAVSAGWNLTNESFLSNNKTFSFLKLKSSYGLIGNVPPDDFLYRANLFLVRYQNQPGLLFNNLGNPNLKWETTAQFDIGLDYGFIGDRITGSIGYYIKNTSDLLFPGPVTQTSGFGSVVSNIASLENKGWEFSLSSKNIVSNDFSWSTEFNITSNQNKITDLPTDRLVVGVNAYLEGESAGVFFIPVFAGVDTETGLALYENNQGGTTTNYEEALENRQVVGDPNPDFFGGLSNSLHYKNFNFQFSFQYVLGVDIYSQTGEELSNSGFLGLSQTIDQLDRWYAPGDIASFPGVNTSADIADPSSRWIQDGSYVRLNNVTISYDFPEKILNSLNLSSLNFYIGGQNLLTFTKYTGFDPDANSVDPLLGSIGANISRGIDNFTAPQARLFITGLKIEF